MEDREEADLCAEMSGIARDGLEVSGRWYDYSRARDMILKKTDTRAAPWYIGRTDDNGQRG